MREVRASSSLRPLKGMSDICFSSNVMKMFDEKHEEDVRLELQELQELHEADGSEPASPIVQKVQLSSSSGKPSSGITETSRCLV